MVKKLKDKRYRKEQNLEVILDRCLLLIFKTSHRRVIQKRQRPKDQFALGHILQN